MAYVRYLVNDVQKAVDFYSAHFDFTVQQQFGPAMAILKRGDLTLWLAGPHASASGRCRTDASLSQGAGIGSWWKLPIWLLRSRN